MPAQIPASLADGLNPHQHEILVHDLDEVPLLVLAGAGTGKTTVITRRLALETLRAGDGGSTLALTFTRKAAGEMRERAGLQLKKAGIHLDPPWCGTFHALGLRILSELHGGLTGWQRLGRKVPRFPDAGEMERLRAAFWRERFRNGDISRAWTPMEIERLRSAWTDPAGLEAAHPDHPGLSIWRDWDRWKELHGVLDFEDLIGLAIRLLEADSGTSERWRDRCRTLLVDEYQDTNRSQYRLVRTLLGGSGRLLAVGDDDQSIYGFRGANISNVLDFRRDFPSARILKLEQNYRSTGAVLRIANRIFPDKPADYRKALRCGRREDGVHARWWLALDEDEELAWIRREVCRYLQHGTAAEDIAVLTRSNRQLGVLRHGLRGLPLQAESGEGGGIRLLTVHAAKGLEWPVVFHPFVDAPRREKPHLLPAADDEERRLFYVAVTRARDHLCLSSSGKRRRRDSWEACEPLPWHQLIRRELSVEPGRWPRFCQFLQRGDARLIKGDSSADDR